MKKLEVTSQRTLDIGGFVPIADIYPGYLEKPYYLSPRSRVAARSCVVLYQSGCEVVIRRR